MHNDCIVHDENHLYNMKSLQLMTMPSISACFYMAHLYIKLSQLKLPSFIIWVCLCENNLSFVSLCCNPHNMISQEFWTAMNAWWSRLISYLSRLDENIKTLNTTYCTAYSKTVARHLWWFSFRSGYLLHKEKNTHTT